MILTSKYIFDTKTKTTFSGYIQIEGKRIVRTGPIDKLPTTGNESVVDYEDKMIVPGFIDAHIHFFLSTLLYNEKLTFITGASEEEVAQQVADLPVIKGWKFGIGWYSSEFGQNIYPSRKSIDKVCPDVPVMLIAGDAHTIWLNSKALAVMEITKNNLPTRISGEALMDEEGMTGVFLEAVAIHYLAKILEPLKENITDEFRVYCRHLNQMGITAVGDVALTGEAEDDFVYPRLYEAFQEDPCIRISFFPAMREDTEKIESLAACYHSETLAFGGVKQFFDGVTSTHTAFLKEEYASPFFPGDKGSPLIPVENMQQLILKANEKSWPIRIHTIGDRAIRSALEYYKKSQQLYPLEEGQYNTLEHLEVMDGNDLEWTNQEQLIISVQPSHLLVGWETLDEEVGEVRADQMFPFKSFLEEGAVLGFGTDSPVVVDVTPLETVYFAVSRRDLSGEPPEGLMSKQRISIAEALYAHTKGAALALSRSDIGSLEEGMLADICILDHFILEDSPEELLQTRVVATYFNGQQVGE